MWLCKNCWKELPQWRRAFCSDTCCSYYRNEENKKWQKEKRRKLKTCVMCGKQDYTENMAKNYCKECSKKKVSCPICWWKKALNSEMCINCHSKKKCAICWKDFVSQSARTLYCSPECKKLWRTKKWKQYCNKNSTTKSSRSIRWNKKSLIEREAFFKEKNIPYEKGFWIQHHQNLIHYDFKIGNFLIEINPSATHNSSFWYRKWTPPKNYKYHFNKTNVWEAAGFQVIHIFDRDNTDKVKNWLIWLLRKRQRLYHWEIREVDGKEAMEFCDRNHLQWKCSCSIWHWLYVKDKLINVMWWKYYSDKEEWHLERFASEQGYYIAHWAEKLFRYFINTYKPERIISFSDRTKHSWNLYKSLGFSTEVLPAPSYRRVNIKENIVVRRRDCQKQKMHLIPWFKKDYKYKWNETDAFWQQTEKQLMESHGYVRIYDAWMRKHIYTFSQKISPASQR